MSQQQWYLAKHGHQIGPMSEAEIVSNIQHGSADSQTLVFTAGMSNWTPLADVPQLATHLSEGADPGQQKGGGIGARPRVQTR